MPGVHGVDYVSIPVPAFDDQPYRIGVRVEIVGDYPGLPSLPNGTRGTVTGWGRDYRTHMHFERTVELARKHNRKLGESDYEILIDSEGPVVTFDNEITEWFCGQAVSPLGPVGA